MTKVAGRRGEFYWIDNVPYISVTNILKVIAKPALRYWFGGEVYNAMIEDPSLSRKEALAAPWRKTKSAQERGSAVHSLVETWKTTGQVVGLTGPYREYALAFSKWLDATGANIKEHERTVVSKKYGYAGTLDAIVDINGKTLVMDVKTGKDLYPEVHLQLSAYRLALSEQGVETDGTCALLLREDGTFKFEYGTDKSKGFLAALYLFRELNAELLEKVMYQSQKLGLFND